MMLRVMAIRCYTRKPTFNYCVLCFCLCGLIDAECVHFDFKHVCTHSLGLFVHTHLEGLVELVHTRSVLCD